MAVTDPVDARLLAMLADMGKAAVHELAARVGMDPREVAYRLVALSGSGLPLLVGVECDPKGLRSATAGAWQGRAGQHSGAHPVQGMPSGPLPGQQPPPAHGTPSGAYPSQGPTAAHGGPSGPNAVHGTPSAAYPVHGTPSAAYPVQGTPSAAYPVQQQTAYPSQPPLKPPPPQQPATGFPPAGPHAVQGGSGPAQVDPSISTWGPPQTASWARGDQDQVGGQPAPPSSGRIGDVRKTQGLEGEQLDIALLEVQDPADFLFGAAGYRLEQGERAVVVHTEIKNTGHVPFVSLPDNYLELITEDGKTVAKAPVSLTSRPPHRIGVRPGETLGGHTVYVLPEMTRVVSVRWNRRPESDEYSLTWSIDD